MEQIDVLKRTIERLIAEQAATDVLLGALIATHPHYHAFQMKATAVVEVADSPQGSWNRLSPEQRQVARDRVEWFQAVRSSLPPAPAGS